MLAFSVVKQLHGWAVCMDDRMTTPFWSRDLAIREANSLANAIRRHGELAEVIVQEADAADALARPAALTPEGPRAFVPRATPY
jgi:hypothetical protein